MANYNEDQREYAGMEDEDEIHYQRVTLPLIRQAAKNEEDFDFDKVPDHLVDQAREDYDRSAAGFLGNIGRPIVEAGEYIEETAFDPERKRLKKDISEAKDAAGKLGEAISEDPVGVARSAGRMVKKGVISGAAKIANDPAAAVSENPWAALELAATMLDPAVGVASKAGEFKALRKGARAVDEMELAPRRPHPKQTELPLDDARGRTEGQPEIQIEQTDKGKRVHTDVYVEPDTDVPFTDEDAMDLAKMEAGDDIAGRQTPVERSIRNEGGSPGKMDDKEYSEYLEDYEIGSGTLTESKPKYRPKSTGKASGPDIDLGPDDRNISKAKPEPEQSVAPDEEEAMSLVDDIARRQAEADVRPEARPDAMEAAGRPSGTRPSSIVERIKEKFGRDPKTTVIAPPPEPRAGGRRPRPDEARGTPPPEEVEFVTDLDTAREIPGFDVEYQKIEQMIGESDNLQRMANKATDPVAKSTLVKRSNQARQKAMEAAESQAARFETRAKAANASDLIANRELAPTIEAAHRSMIELRDKVKAADATNWESERARILDEVMKEVGEE